MVRRGYWESIFLFSPLYPTPEGGCYNGAWEGGSTCVSVIIWALQRSTLKADMFFFFFFCVSLESCGIPEGFPEDPRSFESSSRVYRDAAVKDIEFVIK